VTPRKINGCAVGPGKIQGIGKGGQQTPIDRKAAVAAFFDSAASSVAKESQAAGQSTGFQSTLRSAAVWEIGQTADAIKKAGASSAIIPAGTNISCPCSYPLPPEVFTDILSFEKHLHTNKHNFFRAKLEAPIQCELCDTTFQSVAQKKNHLVSQEHLALAKWIEDAETYLDPSVSGPNVPKFLIPPRVLKRQRNLSPLTLLASQAQSTEHPPSPKNQN
jgi:Zinc-finger of C2H2 type